MSLSFHTQSYEYIKEDEYKEVINDLEKRLSEAKKLYEDRPKGFFPLGYAKAIYEIEKGKSENSICYMEVINYSAGKTSIQIYINERYKISKQTKNKIMNFVLFKLKEDGHGAGNNSEILFYQSKNN